MFQWLFIITGRVMTEKLEIERCGSRILVREPLFLVRLCDSGLLSLVSFLLKNKRAPPCVHHWQTILFKMKAAEHQKQVRMVSVKVAHVCVVGGPGSDGPGWGESGVKGRSGLGLGGEESRVRADHGSNTTTTTTGTRAWQLYNCCFSPAMYRTTNNLTVSAMTSQIMFKLQETFSFSSFVHRDTQRHQKSITSFYEQKYLWFIEFTTNYWQTETFASVPPYTWDIGWTSRTLHPEYRKFDWITKIHLLNS